MKKDEFKSDAERKEEMIVKIYNSGYPFLLKEIIPNDYASIKNKYQEIKKKRSKPIVDPRQADLFIQLP